MPAHAPLMGLAIALLLAAPALAAEPRTLAGRASVIDGDTLEIRGTRIRLIGIDAPEGRQTCRAKETGDTFRCGQTASFHLADMIGTATVRCKTEGRDKYRRTLARCSVRGQDIGGGMVRAGWALPFMSGKRLYQADEAHAIRSGAGLWGTHFVPPWDWRAKAKGRGSRD